MKRPSKNFMSEALSVPKIPKLGRYPHVNTPRTGTVTQPNQFKAPRVARTAVGIKTVRNRSNKY